MAEQREIVPVILRSKDNFTDALTWEKLAEKYMPSYNLPKWDQPCSTEAMDFWQDRLSIDFSRTTNTSHGDFIELNPSWPLRAFVGLMLDELEFANG